MLEALITLSLLLLVVGMLGVTAQQYALLFNRNDAHGQDAFRLELVHRLADELEQATSIVQPVPGGQAGSVATPVEFFKVDPVPGLAAGLVTNTDHIRYTFQPDGRLVRQVTFPSGPDSTQVVCQSLSWFQIDRPDPQLLRLQLSFLSGNQLVSTRLQLFRRWP